MNQNTTLNAEPHSTHLAHHSRSVRKPDPLQSTNAPFRAPLHRDHPKIAYIMERPDRVGDNVRQQILALNQLGAQVTLCFISGDPASFKSPSNADQIDGLRLTPSALSGTRLRASWHLQRWLKKQKPDIIVCDQYKAISTGILAGLYPASQRPGLVALMRGYYAAESSSRRRFYSIFRHRVSAYLTLTRAHQSKIQSDLPDDQKDKVRTITNYIDSSEIRKSLLDRQAARLQLGFPNHVFLFGTICRLDPYKRISDLVHAAHILNEQGWSNFQVSITGYGREETALVELINRLGLQEVVHYHGRVPKAARFLAAFDTFVHPSVGDSFARVLLEARAASLPLIGVDSGGPPEVINQHGLIAQPRDPHDLAEKMATIMTMSPEQRATMGLTGSAWSDTVFTSDKLRQDLSDLLAFFLNQRAQRNGT